TLTENENNFIASAFGGEGRTGLALLDLSTGEFQAAEEDTRSIEQLLAGLPVREAVIPDTQDSTGALIARTLPGCCRELLPAFEFSEEEARRTLLAHFGTPGLDCFGMDDRPLAVTAAGTLLAYVRRLRGGGLDHVTGIRLLAPSDTLFLDPETLRNLEIFEPLRGDAPEAALIGHIDRTRTAAGGRLLRRWLLRPSRILSLIESRLEAVDSLASQPAQLQRLRETMRGLPDIERILARITAGKAGPRDLLSLAEALERAPSVADACDGKYAPLVTEAASALSSQTGALGLIRTGIDPGAPPHLRDGGVIQRGFDKPLDDLIDEAEGGKRWIAALQESERKRTGIPSLKVGFNKVFGYYIEVSRAHLEKIPPDYIGRQTLVNSQRYVTEALKVREQAILSADSRRIELERDIFGRICSDIASESPAILGIARFAALLDVLSSLADCASDRDWCRPVITESDDLVISGGRHPVVEDLAGSGFIPNDLVLRPGERQLLVITGPNMGGKSTYIRQAALIAILAHAGSFVPASRAHIGILDRVFTRVGSSDNLARGQSTFLVEMAETAKILHQCTSKSLVLLDEIGRGTSTLDGLSIAQAVTEYLVENPGRRPKTLFATHYHELTALAERYPRVHNLRVDVKEWGDEILFLYRIVEGAGDKSYGIHVAKLAGLPQTVVDRARSILETLERNRPDPDGSGSTGGQLPLFERPDPVREAIAAIDPDRITPLEALALISRLRAELLKNAD
ncbi:MAG: DNA mismatch repair protein MutS, partial [Candidatus Krumholzibacteria bacterium]|nr:DNA mismatch repair protein MutS [Candidatus Krumholzibacteria bacterium]